MVGSGWEGEWEEGGGRLSGRKGVGGGKTVINILCLNSGWGEGGEIYSISLPANILMLHMDHARWLHNYASQPASRQELILIRTGVQLID